MTYRLTEYCAGHTADSEERNLIVEIHKTLYYDTSGSGTASLLGFLPCLIDLIGILDSALAMAGGPHDRLNNTRDSDLLYSLVKLLAGGCEAIGRSCDAECLMSETPDAFTVHREESSLCGGSDIKAFLLQLYECRSSDCLDLRDYMVGAFQFYDSAEFVAVEHIKHVAAVCHLHSRGSCIFVAYHLHAETLEFESHFLTKFTTSEEHSLASFRSHHTSNLCHFLPIYIEVV